MFRIRLTHFTRSGWGTFFFIANAQREANAQYFVRAAIRIKPQSEALHDHFHASLPIRSNDGEIQKRIVIERSDVDIFLIQRPHLPSPLCIIPIDNNVPIQWIAVELRHTTASPKPAGNKHGK
ncbi:MAG: hypothetical protein B6244_13595 [Candidatus Cloacimonetes bacterium 4572_55]|nr:MAG: hypothetical protein B6244_13595 [Candidatus Cloacimonetes bacterium 4572_55]